MAKKEWQHEIDETEIELLISRLRNGKPAQIESFSDLIEELLLAVGERTAAYEEIEEEYESLEGQKENIEADLESAQIEIDEAQEEIKRIKLIIQTAWDEV